MKPAVRSRRRRVKLEADEVHVGQLTIAFQVRRSSRRRRTIQIALGPEGQVRVLAPLATPVERLRELVRRRAVWIQRHRALAAVPPPPPRFEDGDTLLYQGGALSVRSRPGEHPRVAVALAGESLEVAAPARLAPEQRQAAVERAVLRWYRERAVELLRARVEAWTPLLGVTPGALLVRAHRRRWGSCGPDGTLHFNWRLILCPPELLDYVVVHELAHLRVRNHSPAFWAEVAAVLPDYADRRACLKELGPRLTL